MMVIHDFISYVHDGTWGATLEIKSDSSTADDVGNGMVTIC